VIIYENEDIITNFTHDFSQNEINLSNVGLEITSDSIIVDLGGQLLNSEMKTMYIADEDFIDLCVKDDAIISVSEISSSCDLINEYNFSLCLYNIEDVTIGDITCSDLGDIIKVDNLQHSGVRGTSRPLLSPPTVSSSSGSSGGGGGGSCRSRWECGNWSECSSGRQTRICSDKKKCKRPNNIPVTIQDCACIEKWVCSDWSGCSYEGTKKRDCNDVNECGTIKARPATGMLCESSQMEIKVKVEKPLLIVENPLENIYNLEEEREWFWIYLLLILCFLLIIGIIGLIIYNKRESKKRYFVKQKNQFNQNLFQENSEKEKNNEKELINYVKRNKMRGYTKEDIEKALMNVGWDKKTIKNIFEKIR